MTQTNPATLVTHSPGDRLFTMVTGLVFGVFLSTTVCHAEDKSDSQPDFTEFKAQDYQRPYGPGAPWNVPLQGIPHHPDSGLWVERLWRLSTAARPGNFNLGGFESYSYPVYLAGDATASVPVRARHPDWGNLDGREVPWNPNWKPAAGSDGQIIILDPATGREWNLWQVRFDGQTLTIGNGNLVDGDYRSKEDGFPSSRGAGIPYLAMLTRPEEIMQGAIRHALSMPVKNPSSTFFVPPATKTDGDKFGIPEGVPEGMRFGLRVTDDEIEDWIRQLPGELGETTRRSARIIARALRDYGWIITDNSGGAFFQFEHNNTAGEKWKVLGFDKVKIAGKEYPQDLLDGLLTKERTFAVVPSDQYPAAVGNRADLAPYPASPPKQEPPPLPSGGEWNMDFKSKEAVSNSRLAAPKDIQLQHSPDGRTGEGSLMAANTGTKVQYLSLRCDDLCDEGEGLLVSLWVRKVSGTSREPRCALSLKVANKSGKNGSVSLSSVPLAQDQWTLLSGWCYRGPKSGSPLEIKVSVPAGEKVLIDDVVLLRSAVVQPIDQREPLMVKGAQVMEGDKRFLLHGINLYGSSDDEKGDTRQETSVVTEDDYRDIAAAGFNCVRLNVWHKVFREAGGWEWLKLHCLWARRHGLRIILDMHSPPGGYQSNDYKGEFWKSPQMQQDLIDFWVQAAATLKHDPVIAAFDLMNEPLPPTERDWLAFASRALEEIRKTGWDRPVIVESSMLADGWLADSPVFADRGVIYDTHFYTPWSFTSTGKSRYGEPCVDYGKRVLDADFIKEHLERDLLAFAKKNNVPVNIGEFGVSEKALEVGGEQWLAATLDVINKQGVGRQYFCWCVYGDFAIEPGWFRQSPPKRRGNVMTILNDYGPKH